MKHKLIYTFSFILFAFAACTNMKTEIAKKWKLTSSVNPMRDTMYAQMNRKVNSLNDSIASVTDTAKLRELNEQLGKEQYSLNLFNESIKQLLNESFLDLKSNGEYSSNVTGNENGKWELSGDKKYIYFHPKEKSNSDTLIIKEFNASGKLVLAFDSLTYLTFAPDKPE